MSLQQNLLTHLFAKPMYGFTNSSGISTLQKKKANSNHKLWRLLWVFISRTCLSSPVGWRTYMYGTRPFKNHSFFTFIYWLSVVERSVRQTHNAFRKRQFGAPFKVAEHCIGSFSVYVICQTMARERLQLESWNLASEKYTNQRFWLTGKIWLFHSFHGNMNDWIQP